MVNYEKEIQTARKNLLNKVDNKKILKENQEIIFQFQKQISAEGLSKNRQRKYYYMLGKIAENLNTSFRKVTKNDVVNLVSWINDSYDSEETKRDYRVAIKRIIRFVREKQGAEFEQYEYPKEVKWLKSSCKNENKILPKELLTENDIINIAENTQNLRDRAFILLLYETGARIGEILNVKIKDLDYSTGDKYATINLFGKTGSRVIPIVFSYPAISNWLLEHPNKNKKDFKESFLFCGIQGGKRYGKSMNYDYTRKLLKVNGKRAGILKPLNPHHFRHSRATYLATKFTDAQLKQYFGWGQSSRQTSTYIHLSGRDINDAVLKLHGLKNKEEFESMMKTKNCPRCKTVNDPSAKFCSQCSLGLDEKSIIMWDKQKKEATQVGIALQKAMPKDDMYQMMFEKLQNMEKELKELKKQK